MACAVWVNVMAGMCLLLRTGFNRPKFSRTREISTTHHSPFPAESKERNTHGRCLLRDEAGCVRGSPCAVWAGSLKASSGLGWNRKIYSTDNTVRFVRVHRNIYLGTLHLSQKPLLTLPAISWSVQLATKRGCSTAPAHEVSDGFLGFSP